ncbi:pro-neuregulin-4, membrane-bound isoform-like [Entelurus aequoreus]|uniref:pro-neuregulin-4, membrane-bound isoform-like n=1 Tax=Entelurus aequoreus TaxID=161455 RepID=UPI002B1DF9B2|nr:pro-neuregulin-4, membrane-bound isoform-like [Entelurus aequoreus]XP_061917311.1 pro-neuregulin-4, membrane-bound isoform-like [Entelurus aequoreus]
MMAEHGAPCDGWEATYCMNGGTCYKIASMDTLSCVCNDNYKGSRCEQFQLLLRSSEAEQAGLIAALVIVALFILMVLAVIIFFTHRMLKARNQSRQSQQAYWKIQPRV